MVSKPKYEQLIKNNYNTDFNYTILPPSNTLFLDNSWLAGFAQADGCFHISIVRSKTHKTGYSVRLEFSLKQNDPVPLKLLYKTVKLGNISQYSSGIWCYKSTGFKTAALLINYFDKYNVFAGKYVSYLKFRKVYIMITKGQHLEEEGVAKIKRKIRNMIQESNLNIFCFVFFIFFMVDIKFNSILLSSDDSFTLLLSYLVGGFGFFRF